ncbi:MAG TPA: Thivi_2564 family membrane protein [Bryobacteraceae bacterium]|nr:Thivi_2564 family membrane protein [Bryobacteraceae bacterium]
MTENGSELTKSIRTIVSIVLGLIVVGIVLWLIDTYIPMAASIKAILNIVVVIATCVMVLQAVGLWDYVMRMWNNLTKGRFQH